MTKLNSTNTLTSWKCYQAGPFIIRFTSPRQGKTDVLSFNGKGCLPGLSLFFLIFGTTANYAQGLLPEKLQGLGLEPVSPAFSTIFPRGL